MVTPLRLLRTRAQNEAITSLIKTSLCVNIYPKVSLRLFFDIINSNQRLYYVYTGPLTGMGERHDEPSLDELRLVADRWRKDKVHPTPLTYKLIADKLEEEMPRPLSSYSKSGTYSRISPKRPSKTWCGTPPILGGELGEGTSQERHHSFNAHSRGRWLWRFSPLQGGGGTTMTIAAPLATEAALGAAPPGGTSIWGRGPVLFTDKPPFQLIS
jgi:hypothetical protein